MKVVLMKNVDKIGRAHDTVEVSDGHAINLLIPKGIAIMATPSAVKNADQRKAKAVTEREVQEQLIVQNLETLAKARIVITSKVNEKGRLYDAVGVGEISKAVKEQTSVELPNDTIRLKSPIKEVGTHEVPVAHGENFGKFSIIIEAEV